MPKRKGNQLHFYENGEYTRSRPAHKRAVDVFAGGGSVAGKLRKRRDTMEGSRAPGYYQAPLRITGRVGKSPEYNRNYHKQGNR